MLLRTGRPDVCIVGAGVAGGLLAALLTRRGRSVVLVDAGRRFDRSERPGQLLDWQVGRDPWEWQDEARDVFAVDPDTPYPLNGTRVKAVGGSTLHWGGVANRLHASDFERHTRYGLGPDWPIDYRDLEPWYGMAEGEMGVSGTQSPGMPSRSAPFPMDAFPDGPGYGWWRHRMADLGVDVFSTPVAKNRVVRGGRPPCAATGTCHICPIGAQYSGDVHVLEAERSGLCQVMDRTVARRVEPGADGSVSTVFASRLDGSEVEIEASTVVVAAHAVESARLLLLSGWGRRFDALGRYLMEHYYVGGRGVRPRGIQRGIIGWHLLESAAFYEGEHRRDGGAVKLEFNLGGEPLQHLVRGTPRRWGAGLRELECTTLGRSMGIGAETEHLPNPASRVTLSPEMVDGFGDPAPHVRFSFDERDRRTHERAAARIEELLSSVGLTEIEVWRDPSPAAHHMGTCRMSTDPDEGVVDANLRVHGTSNLYVLGSAVFPTAGAVQPTLTIAALACRLAEHLSPA